MTKRICKKIAKRYLDGGNVDRWILCRSEYWICNGDGTKTELVFPGRIRAAIRAEAYRRGWDGNHWDDPCVIDVTYMEDLP